MVQIYPKKLKTMAPQCPWRTTTGTFWTLGVRISAADLVFFGGITRSPNQGPHPHWTKTDLEDCPHVPPDIHHLRELRVLVHVHHDVAAADELPLHVQLRGRGNGLFAPPTKDLEDTICDAF